MMLLLYSIGSYMRVLIEQALGFKHALTGSSPVRRSDIK